MSYMAKAKTKTVKQEIMLEMIDYTPTKEVNGEKVKQCYADGTPVVSNTDNEAETEKKDETVGV